MEWAYGVTTVPSRLNNTLIRTLDSLKKAGFPDPALFVDGLASNFCYRGLKVVSRGSAPLRTVGNWMLGVWELYVRNPSADRYAIFQDDAVFSSNLRQYLERAEYPSQGYLNLYTFPENEKPTVGFHPSNQLGRGAVALVFSNDAIRVLLAQPWLTEWVSNPKKGFKNLDGMIVTAMGHAGWKEYTHTPSLCEHKDDGVSTIGNPRFESSQSFQGEEFDCLSLLQEKPPAVRKELRRIGLVGYHCANVYGEMNRQIARYLKPDSWLILPHPEYPTREMPNDIDCTLCYTGRRDKVDTFARTVDVLVFVGNPQYPTLMDAALKYKRRTVCIPMSDEPTDECSWAKEVSLFVCPTRDIYERLKTQHPCKGFDWPWDIECNPYVGYLGETVDTASDQRHQAELNRWSARAFEFRSLCLDGSQPIAVSPAQFLAMRGG
jgi:hypothetical protein